LQKHIELGYLDEHQEVQMESYLISKASPFPIVSRPAGKKADDLTE